MKYQDRVLLHLYKKNNVINTERRWGIERHVQCHCSWCRGNSWGCTGLPPGTVCQGDPWLCASTDSVEGKKINLSQSQWHVLCMFLQYDEIWISNIPSAKVSIWVSVVTAPKAEVWHLMKLNLNSTNKCFKNLMKKLNDLFQYRS